MEEQQPTQVADTNEPIRGQQSLLAISPTTTIFGTRKNPMLVNISPRRPKVNNDEKLSPQRYPIRREYSIRSPDLSLPTDEMMKDHQLKELTNCVISLEHGKTWLMDLTKCINLHTTPLIILKANDSQLVTSWAARLEPFFLEKSKRSTNFKYKMDTFDSLNLVDTLRNPTEHFFTTVLLNFWTQQPESQERSEWLAAGKQSFQKYDAVTNASLYFESLSLHENKTASAAITVASSQSQNLLPKDDLFESSIDNSGSITGARYIPNSHLYALNFASKTSVSKIHNLFDNTAIMNPVCVEMLGALYANICQNRNSWLSIFSGRCLALEGLIGAGKSTLATLISLLLDLAGIPNQLFLEHKNPEYLNAFIQNQSKYAFGFQLYMLKERIYSAKLGCREALQKGKVVIYDRTKFGDYAFFKLQVQYGNISLEEASIYEKTFSEAMKEIAPPDFMIELNVQPQISYGRANGRDGKEYELDYYMQLGECYKEAFERAKVNTGIVFFSLEHNEDLTHFSEWQKSQGDWNSPNTYLCLNHVADLLNLLVEKKGEWVQKCFFPKNGEKMSSSSIPLNVSPKNKGA